MSKASDINKFYTSLLENEHEEICPDKVIINFTGKSWYQKEFERVESLFNHDVSMASDVKLPSSSLIVGIDEVGRGPMAGPVVAAAVVFDRFHFLPGLDDSKKIRETIRNHICETVKKSALSWGIGIVTAEEIDKINIHNASLLAMKRAFDKLNCSAVLALIDGRHLIPELPIKQKYIIKGDAKSFAIGAASVLAKVTRDAMMDDYEKEYPGYGFNAHKGYCTKAHREALQKLGPCPIHRQSFAPVRNLQPEGIQLTLI